MKRQTTLILLCALFMLVGMSSCAPAGHAGPYGIIGGFCHGFLIIFEVIAKLIGQPYGLYAANNNGAPYWVGYIIGIFGFGGGGIGIFSR